MTTSASVPQKLGNLSFSEQLVIAGMLVGARAHLDQHVSSTFAPLIRAEHFVNGCQFVPNLTYSMHGEPCLEVSITRAKYSPAPERPFRVRIYLESLNEFVGDLQNLPMEVI